MNDHEQMIISALQYALPRRSYITSFTEDYIRRMLNGKVSHNFVDVCISDIQDHYAEMDRLDYGTAGQPDWNPLLNKLKSYKLTLE